MNIVISVLFKRSINDFNSDEKLIYEDAIKKPITTGKNFSGPSITSIIVLFHNDLGLF